MPIYEYQCGSCGERSELLQRVGAPSNATCPKCKGEMTRLVSAPAIQFKGTGWYVTDYANKGRSGNAASPSKEEGSSGSTKSSSSEASDKGSSPKSGKEASSKDSKSKAG